MMTRYSSLVEPIQAALPRLASLRAMLGFDGTVDVICKPVESRKGTGPQFQPYGRMRDFGERIVAADGKSAIIEIVKELEKIGGNGPVMANALAGAGIAVDYLGPLGQPELHPAYAAFGNGIQVHSVGQPAVTHALEFPNGKLMLASISTYDTINASTLDAELGAEAMIRMIQDAQLCCLLNWTCLPGFNSILEWYLDALLPAAGNSRERIFFFDLADPSMRSDADLRQVLELISGFNYFGRVILGMNLNESQQVCRALQIPEPASAAAPLCAALTRVRERLAIDTAMAHPTDFAACATDAGSWAVQGPHTDKPLITTGAGDHLNAGFCLAQALSFSPEDALKLGVLFSGYYVRKAQSPGFNDILQFLADSNVDEN